MAVLLRWSHSPALQQTAPQGVQMSGCESPVLWGTPQTLVQGTVWSQQPSWNPFPVPPTWNADSQSSDHEYLHSWSSLTQSYWRRLRLTSCVLQISLFDGHRWVRLSHISKYIVISFWHFKYLSKIRQFA